MRARRSLAHRSSLEAARWTQSRELSRPPALSICSRFISPPRASFRRRRQVFQPSTDYCSFSIRQEKAWCRGTTPALVTEISVPLHLRLLSWQVITSSGSLFLTISQAAQGG